MGTMDHHAERSLEVRAFDPSSSPNLMERARIELGKQLWLALPMIGINLVQFSRQLVSVMLLGHLGELELSSASIATSFCSVTGYSFMKGLASALVTVCGQAYGAKQYHLLGIYMQRAMLLLNIIAIPVAILWFNMEHVLLVFGQAPEISAKAGTYARCMIPGLFAIAVLQPLVKFLQTQSKVLPMFLCSAATLVLHTTLCWFLVYKMGLGNVGAALTVSFSYWLNVALLVIVVVMTPSCRKCWNGFSKEALHGVREFLNLAFPSAVMLCLELWSFEALVLLSGLLPDPELETSVFSILLNTICICFMIPNGIGAAVSIRVSNELGSGSPAAAQFAFYISMGITAVEAILMSSSVLLSRNVLGKAFSSEPEVVDQVATMVPFLAGISIMDAMQGVVSGVARGCGWQATAAVANLGAYYVIGLPLGYILAFNFRMRGKGLLIGLLCGVAAQATSLATISAFFTNWTAQARAASKRVVCSASTTPLLK